MPKSAKHKKARQADFTKAKLKLGKGKQLASNATNTSFTAKNIALPNQHLAEEKDEPVSKRNLTVDELLVQARHYNANVRREAVSDLRYLVDKHPQLIERHLIGLVNACAHLIADATAQIRRTALELLRFLFEHSPKQAMDTAATTLTLFTLTALTSIDEGVRISALDVLDLVIEMLPERIAQPSTADDDSSLATKISDALLTMLKVKSATGATTTVSSSDLSPNLRKAVLQTLSAFLKVRSTLASDLPWYLASSFANTRDFTSFLDMASPSTVPSVSWDAVPVQPDYYLARPSTSQLTLESLSLPATMVAAGTSSDRTLASLLHSTLLSTYLDSAPSAFGPSSDPTHVETVAAVLRLVIELYRSELSTADDSAHANGLTDEAQKNLAQLLGRFYTYFPFELPKGDGELGVELNLIFAELVSLLAMSQGTSTSSTQRAKAKGKGKCRDDGRVDRMLADVTDWLVRYIRGEVSTADMPLGLSLSDSTFEQLEPTLWTLLNQPSPSDAAAIGGAEQQQKEDDIWLTLLDHFDRVGPASPLKRRSFAFLSRCVLTQYVSTFRNAFSIAASSERRQRTGKWISTSLPKSLWQLDAKDERLTNDILHFMSLVLRFDSHESSSSSSSVTPRRSPALFDEGQAALSTTFATFFSVDRPSQQPQPSNKKNGSSSSNGTTTVQGPYGRCTAQVQKRAREIAGLLGGAAQERSLLVLS